MKNKNLYNWVFTYNPYEDKWLATTRDSYTKLFSNSKSESVLKSSSIYTLIELINKTNGDKVKINRLING